MKTAAGEEFAVYGSLDEMHAADEPSPAPGHMRAQFMLMGETPDDTRYLTWLMPTSRARAVGEHLIAAADDIDRLAPAT